MNTKERRKGALLKRKGASPPVRKGASPPVSYNSLAALATPDGSRRAATNRAPAAAKSRPSNHHFVEVNKMIQLGKGAKREVPGHAGADHFANVGKKVERRLSSDEKKALQTPDKLEGE